MLLKLFDIIIIIREFNQQRRRQLRKRHLKRISAASNFIAPKPIPSSLIPRQMLANLFVVEF